MEMIKKILLVFMIGWGLMSYAQRDSVKTDFFAQRATAPKGFVIDVSYGMQLPLADMAEHFLYSFSIGGGVQYILPNNLMLGLCGDYMFSDEIARDIISNLRESEGFLIDRFGRLTDVRLGQRTFFLGASIAYLIPVFKKYKRSGIEIRFESGYLQHWINIEVLGSEVFGLSGEYIKGYDRMTSGFAMRQYIGFRHLDKKRLINLFIGVNILEGFTQNRRNVNFDTMLVDDKNRIDVQIGFKLGLSSPFYLYSIASDLDDIRYY